jgi:SAM-dependent methyltransferase
VSEPVRAGSDWLALREPADAAARSVELVEELLSFLPEGRLVVHDLGCGTGSMARWLAPRLAGPQHWVLHDRDAALLHRVGLTPPPVSSDGVEVTVETRRGDITRLEPVGLAGASLVTASALLDMMTAEELGRFVDVCAQAVCPVLVTLSVVGRVQLTPTDPFDRVVMNAFNAHQGRDISGGRLFGSDAARAAVAGFTARGLDVTVRPSPWRLAPKLSELMAEWFTGWLGAATEQRPDLREAAVPYARRRLREAADGSLSVTVHHEDLLAVPRSPSRRSPAAVWTAANRTSSAYASPPADTSTSSASAPTTRADHPGRQASSELAKRNCSHPQAPSGDILI